MKRRAARGIAVLTVALAAGHLVQSIGNKHTPKPPASAELQTLPANVETVSAGPEVTKPIPPVPAKAEPALRLTAIVPLPVPAELSNPALLRRDNTLAALAPDTEAKAPRLAEPLARSCEASLDLMVEENAMLGLTLIAPCNPDQRVVLRHGGLAITGKTTVTGALFATLPAMETTAAVDVSFADGTKAQAEIAVPEMAGLRRFGVQWQADDAFQLNAFENGAGYGEAGHVSALSPHHPAPGLAAKGGYLMSLGDSTTANPLLAEIYTFPTNPAITSEIVVEAAVTEKTCGRELLADTLTSNGGALSVTDLTLAMPECDAVGDYMVLKNLALDLNMAAVN